MQPGDVIGPGGNPPEDTEKPAEEPKPVSAESSEVENPQEPVEEAQASEEPDSNWQFSDESQEMAADNVPQAPREAVSWTASEYIAHEKSGSWYVLLAVAVIIFAALVYLITRETISTAVVIIMGAAFGTFAARKPQELTYVLDNTALKVGPKVYPYSQFKSFTIVEEGAIHSIMLMPLQRFMPPLSVYYDPSDEDKIADALSSYLPYEDRKQDAVDRLMRKVRF